MIKKYKLIGLFLLCFVIASTAMAQGPQIEGSVLSERGDPLAGVTVRIVESNNNANTRLTATNASGIFTFNNVVYGSSYNLYFEYIGYATDSLIDYRINTNGKNTLMIRLTEQASDLDEIVVVGYGTQRRSSVTGAVNQITTEDIKGKPTPTLTEALQGVSPNLIVQTNSYEPGQGLNLNIRGIGTIGDNSPLIVIDGIVGGDMNLINAGDVESISVLKDAGSAAIYGSRSANGVILITTKKGRRNTRPTINYSGTIGYQVPKILYKPVHGFENAILKNQTLVNGGQSPLFSPDEIRALKDSGDAPFFLDEIFKKALLQTHNLSVSGGSEKSTYMISAGYTGQQSNYVGPDYGIKRYTYRTNLSTEVGRLKITSMLSYVHTDNKDHSFATGFLMADAQRVPVYYYNRMKDANGNYLTNDALQEFNPLGVLEKGGFRKYDDDQIMGNVEGDFKITDFLKLRGTFGITRTANHQYSRLLTLNFVPKGTWGANRDTYDENYKGSLTNSNLILDFNKTFNGRHVTSALVGYTYEYYKGESNSILKRFTDPELGTPGTGTIIVPDGSWNTPNRTQEWGLNSAIARATYAYDNKYFAEFNFRADGSSRFAKANRWGYFPSLSLGYRISDETFMQNYKNNVGSIKLRGSYGSLGNQNVGNYQYQTTIGAGVNMYGFNNNPVSGANFAFANRDIRWERHNIFNIGADLTFFENRLSMSLDYFNKHTVDILLSPQVPGIFGSGLPNYNAGEVSNKGWEIDLSYNNKNGEVKHFINFNLADTKNEWLKLEGGRQLIGLEEAQLLNEIGFPLFSYVALKRDGYFQTMEEIQAGPRVPGLNVQPGDNRYVDVDGNGIINERDVFVLGNAFPRLTFGFTYNIAYKGFDLNIFIQGVGKRSTFLRGELLEPFHYNYGQTMYQHQLDFWTPVNPNARYPRLAESGSASNVNNFRRGSDMYLFNAAYARLKNVQLGYTIPPRFAERAGMKNCRIYVIGRNLLTLSQLKFYDPEATEFGNRMDNRGANTGRAYPTPVYYGFGLDITF